MSSLSQGSPCSPFPIFLISMSVPLTCYMFFILELGSSLYFVVVISFSWYFRICDYC
ncbi:hypothetical protein Zm00014a_022496 [Zea mays]|uniref:Uncharacterized protein n=1 Tax=Zea mays TaxID=4577 RepID=A0A3L6FLG3_MAIZE|nr:hypothetical protein Zm00014a_022496 [Zea mays]